MYSSLRHSPFPAGGAKFLTTSIRSPASSHLTRSYATQSTLGGNGSSSGSKPARKQISVMSDDGRYRWGELSGGEKVARATQQSFNFLIVALGVVMTVRLSSRFSPCHLKTCSDGWIQGGVITLLYTDVFSPNSKTWQFEKAVSRIKEDPRCTALLGDSKSLKAYGEATWNRWARNRPIAYVEFDSPKKQKTLADVEKDNGSKRLHRTWTYAHNFQCELQAENSFSQWTRPDNYFRLKVLWIEVSCTCIWLNQSTIINSITDFSL
jgi:hypothetical protein